ncbi:BZIP transcription factor [Phytophthora cinnamomi]|uniref:BZIP transcription factor n=1 Tax=Phytophthora cinnamomi TaxID=4785 RepID=UPI003559A047|nr:BZIP transcription factor [Phytophthora cinnamomi]
MASSSFLCPPNSYALSDNVIGGVVQRVTPLHNRLDDASRGSYRIFTAARQYSSQEPQPQQQQQSAIIGRKRLPPLQSLADAATTQTPHDPREGRKMHVSASRRERCRINQARYRKRQRKHAEDLDNGIQQLQEQIQELETQRQSLLRYAPTNESVWIVATEYFRLFRQGYKAPTKTPDMFSSSNDGQDMSRLKQAHAQLDFLRAAMAADVTDGPVSGADAILKHWKLLSLYHGDVQVQLKRLQQGGGSSVVATTRVSLTINENSLRCIYPHLAAGRSSEEDGDSSSLTTKLLNQRLVARGSVRFDWDDRSGRIVRLETKMDLMSAMFELLGNLEDVAQVFESAAITPEGRFIDRSSCASASTTTSFPLQTQRNW